MDNIGDVSGPVGTALTEQQRKEHIGALLRERSHNEARGKPTVEIDDQLQRYGHQAAAPAKRAATRERKQGVERA